VAKKTARTAEDTPDFEQALKELEAIVERMEQGDATLEESLKQFERGIALTRACQQALKAAGQKVEILIEENGKIDTRSLDVDEQD
jgi:exodeoxyribonuclease VII small subunit